MDELIRLSEIAIDQDSGRRQILASRQLAVFLKHFFHSFHELVVVVRIHGEGFNRQGWRLIFIVQLATKMK